MTRDEGSGTVLTLAILGVVTVVGLAVAGVAAAASARAVAQSAADLAALAGADSLLLTGGQEPAGACDRAREVAERNGAALEECAPEPGSVVVVRVSRGTAIGPARAAARAGPASARSAGP